MKAHTQYFVAALAVFLLVGVPARAQDAAAGGWRPYLDDKGKEKPLDLAKAKDKDWVKVRYTAFPGGFKPRLGVVIPQQQSDTSAPPIQSETLRVLEMFAPKEQTEIPPVQHVEDMVRQALGATGRFAMIDRGEAEVAVLEEQMRTEGGTVDTRRAPRTGQMKGVDYVVRATIIELNPAKDAKQINAAAGGIGPRTIGIGSIGVKGTVAFCRLNVQLINTSTNECFQDLTVDGTASASDLNVGGGFLKGVTKGVIGGGGGVDQKSAVVLSDAVQACANKIAYQIAIAVDRLPWEGAVARVAPLVIDAGRDIGLATGLELQLFSKGEEIEDEAGNSLGCLRTPIGRVRIVDVQEKFSVCELVEGTGEVKTGDIVLLGPKRI